MKTVLVTGPAGFLGHHVIRQLNSNGIRPRVLLPPDLDDDLPNVKALNQQNVEIIPGDIDDPAVLQAACSGVDTIMHLHFEITLGGGPSAKKALHEENVQGTRNLLDAAAKARVPRVVISSSALAVGLHHEANTLDENADWEQYAFSLPYAESRRDAEQMALSQTGLNLPEVVVVNPSFTLGPHDWIGAPANRLVMAMTSPKFCITAPIGFGVLDVRDYADGVIRAAERGKPGRRYILSSDNLTPHQLAHEVAGAVGNKPSKHFFNLRTWIVYPIVVLVELWSKLRGKSSPVTRDILELWGRYAWYDNSLARNELGWNPRPLQETLRDTIEWHKQNSAKEKD
ncbi:dihydroflavonol-4-reductase [Nitrosomonas sp. Nm51]|uniref:NAD-dependent epimerase/dehydratase family protein n=1 Tax=Nitrosomonas sp. Nm51 TaxID=133720 RepID=UPI0008AE0EB9|nr:NAD-dependent epimerase/dehydratase family protein [Nitrosomonas sp. Nm51]SER54780.1 dihydroflavonol-4-reductase [Nitrosomonas sp. Nm51]